MLSKLSKQPFDYTHVTGENVPKPADKSFFCDLRVDGVIEAYPFLLFAAVCITAAAIPGPSVILAIRNSAGGGVRRAMGGVLGHSSAIILYLLVTDRILTLFVVINPRYLYYGGMAGGIYLVYLGISSLYKNRSYDLSSNDSKAAYYMFRESFLLGLSNPKVILFFSAILPTYYAQYEGHYRFLLHIIVVIVSFSVLSIYVICSKYLSKSGHFTTASIFSISGILLFCFGIAIIYKTIAGV